VGFSIQGPNKRAIFIPDIDKWELWKHNIDSVITAHDYAFLDGSFFANGEIPGRDMSEIPHPFVEESLKRFSTLPSSEKSKIHFIHFNHTNPLINPNSKASTAVIDAGMHVARGFEQFEM
ncbi:MAG: pyrroloquinoline quinone biosynthesis protein PqqB, partial [Bacteroidota bacterium]